MELTNYWWLLIWMFTGGAFLDVFFPKSTELVIGKKEVRWDIVPAILLVLPYIIWAGFRSNNFGDTYAYRKMFSEAPNTLSQLPKYLGTINKDKGFSAFTVFIKSFLGDSDIVFFLIIASIQLVIIAMVFRKYSSDYWFSMFVFIASTDYLSWAHNGIRQFLAVTIIFASTPLLLKKKYTQAILLILFASTMHKSALLMIPVIFIIQGEAWNKRSLLCIAASIVALAFVDQFTNVLDALVTDTQYANMINDWNEWGDDGTNPIRVLVYSVPTILAFIGRKWIHNENDPVINLSVNASIISVGLLILSSRTSGIFLGRLPIYVSL